jgi:4a-hydroxytetrahydrobiopterin dehydratase
MKKNSTLPLIRLSNQEIESHLAKLNQWHCDDALSMIYKEWVFESFQLAVNFFTQIAALAETQNHHPDIFSAYKRIKISISTHDVGGLTDKDFALAQSIDQLKLMTGMG